jgi:hypothetical protein
MNFRVPSCFASLDVIVVKEFCLEKKEDRPTGPYVEALVNPS